MKHVLLLEATWEFPVQRGCIPCLCTGYCAFVRMLYSYLVLCSKSTRFILCVEMAAYSMVVTLRL